MFGKKQNSDLKKTEQSTENALKQAQKEKAAEERKKVKNREKAKVARKSRRIK